MDEPTLSPLAQKIKEELLGEFQLTVDDVAGILEVERSSIYRYIQDGRLVALKLGREYRLTEADVREFIGRLLAQMRQSAAVAPDDPTAPGATGIKGPGRRMAKFGGNSHMVFTRAHRLALLEQSSVRPVHLLWAALATLQEEGEELPAYLTVPEPIWKPVGKRNDTPPMSEEAKTILSKGISRVIAERKSTVILAGHILLAVITGGDPEVREVLFNWGGNLADLIRLGESGHHMTGEFGDA